MTERRHSKTINLLNEEFSYTYATESELDELNKAEDSFNHEVDRFRKHLLLDKISSKSEERLLKLVSFKYALSNVKSNHQCKQQQILISELQSQLQAISNDFRALNKENDELKEQANKLYDELNAKQLIDNELASLIKDL